MKQIHPKFVVPLPLVTVLTWLCRGLNRSRIPLLAAGLIAESASGAPGLRTSLNGFDVSNATIPTSEILSGGPGRDGIPSIDKPRFIRPIAANFMSADDLVVSVTIGDKTRAYPLRILVWHEIVNDALGGKAIAVTYCPLCGTAMVFNRQVGERSVKVYWFAWQAFYPQTGLWRAE